MSDLGIEIYNSSGNIQLDSDYFTLYLKNTINIDTSTHEMSNFGDTLNTEGVFAIKPDIGEWCTWVSTGSNTSTGPGKLYNFSTSPSSDNSNYGLEVYNQSSKTIFSSDFKSIKVIDEIIEPHTGGSGTIWSKNYGTTDIAVIPQSVYRAASASQVGGPHTFAVHVYTYAFKLDSDGTLSAGLKQIFFTVGAGGSGTFGEKLCKFLVIDTSGF